MRASPVASVAFYGPDNTRASKVAVGIVAAEGAEPIMQRWFVEDGDARTDVAIAREMLKFMKDHGVKSVVNPPQIIGCPHEEGIDYPDGQVCPQCPFWASRDRWTGEFVQ
ncbi:MAG: hypothetical protein U0Q16_35895 [Bryobacteraceae bacterium]